MYCDACLETVPSNMYQGHLRSNRHKNNIRAADDDVGVEVLQSAFKSRLVSYRVSSANYHIHAREFLNELKNKVLNVVTRDLRKFFSAKINFELFGYYVLESQNIYDVKSFNSKNVIVTVSTDLNAMYDDFTAILDQKADEFQERESGKHI